MSMIVPDEYLLKKEDEIIPDVENDWVEVRSDNAVLGNTIRHHYRNTNSYINLSKSYLEINFSVTANDTTHTISNHVLSLFRRATLKIGNVTCEQIENQHLNILVNSIIKYSQDYALSSGSNAMFYRDTGNGEIESNFTTNGLNPVGPGNLLNLNFNEGYQRRLARTTGGGVVSCRVPLMEVFQIASVDKLIYGQELEIELVQAPDNERIYGGPDVLAPTILVNKVSVWLNRVIPSKQNESVILKQIQAGVSYDFNFLYSNAYLSSPLQASSQVVRISTQSENVQFGYVMAVPTNFATNVSKSVTPNFIDSCNLLVDNIRFPVNRYENLTNELGKARSFHALSQMTNAFDLSSGLSLSFDDYKRCTIIPFDLQNKLKNVSGSATQIELEITLNTACRVLVVLQSDRIVNINYQGGNAVIKVN